MAPLLRELSPQTTERFRHNYTVSLIKMQSHRGHLGKLLFKRMAELGVPIRRREGQNEGRWIILDYGFMLVHIFHTEEYEYYNLERLWTDGSNRLVLPFDQTDL